MNFSVTTNDVPSPDSMKSLTFGKLLIFAAGLSLLAACAELPKRTPPSKPTVATMTRPPVVPPATVAVQPAMNGIILVAPANHELEKKRIKTQLSKNTRDSLPDSDVGYYMDVLQGRVKQKIGKTKGVGMARNGDLIVIVMRGRAGFEGSNSQVTAGIRQFLAPLSKVLVEYHMTLVSVRIRSEESDMANSQLNELRSQAVARFLMDAGVSGKRMIVLGTGKNEVTQASSGPASRERIELQLEPIVRPAGE
ncbi:MAG: OmpA family protein [Arenimonas sp.]